MLPEIADEAIGSGRIDFAAMGRQLLADPDLPRKIETGNFEQVRPCINCYVCVAENFWDDTPYCAVNPALAHESRFPFAPAETPKKVVVIGAGPAGLETARVLTERGHRVTVLDQSDRLGGTLWFSTLTTPDNERLLNWLSSEVTRLGIDVRLNTTADVASVSALQPDLVVVATGAVRPRPDVPGGDLPHVHTGDSLRDLITGSADSSGGSRLLRTLGKIGKMSGVTKSPEAIRQVTKRFLPMGKNIVVIGGSLVGLELAEWLAERGRNVTLLEEGQQLGVPMAMPRRWAAVGKARELGITTHRHATVNRITKDAVEFTVADETLTAPADAVIFAAGTMAAAPLADELSAAGLTVEVIGDAREVNYIEGAIHSAWDLATTY